jgi:hypothetical protein
MRDTMHETTDALTVASRLRRARLAVGLELRDIEQRTRISPSILRWIDSGDFHRLPAGIYARSYVRAFAQAVGLDPNEVLASLEHELPQAVDPIAVAVENSAPARFPPLSPEWLRVAAATVDAAILSTVYGLVLGATAAVCGRPLAEVLAPGLPAIVIVLAVLTALYFVVFAGIEGRTPGGRLFGLAPLDIAGPAHVKAIVARAGRVFMTEASLGVEAASRRPASNPVPAVDPYGSRSTP